MRCLPWGLVAALAGAACDSRSPSADGPTRAAIELEPPQSVLGRSPDPKAQALPASEAVPVDQRKTAVLVELFSSQGCDSCPAADAFIGRFAERGWTPDRVIALTFHVTYWDDLGWSDPYGEQLHDQRQIAYAQMLPGARSADENTIRGPYTPQMVVDGRVHFSGTLEDVAAREIEAAAGRARTIELEVVAEATKEAGVRVRVESRATEGAKLDTDRAKIGLFAVLSQAQVQTEVPRGENAGKKLDEFSVVRAFSGPKLFRSARAVNETTFVLAPPEGVDLGELGVVVFAQDLASLAVLEASVVAIAEAAG
jgi:hypothetical protein